MLKKSMFGYSRTDEVGFLFDTFVNKVYLATYVCILVFIIMSVILYCALRQGSVPAARIRGPPTAWVSMCLRCAMRA